MAQKSNKQRSGRYVYGGKVDDLSNRLGWWERTVFPTSVTDINITLLSKYNKRPDLLAYDLYGKSTLGWFILQYNSIIDVTTFVQGLTLAVPTKSRLFLELLKNPNT